MLQLVFVPYNKLTRQSVFCDLYTRFNQQIGRCNEKQTRTIQSSEKESTDLSLVEDMAKSNLLRCVGAVQILIENDEHFAWLDLQYSRSI